jgi:hypothetical protein
VQRNYVSIHRQVSEQTVDRISVTKVEYYSTLIFYPRNWSENRESGVNAEMELPEEARE